MSGVFTQPVVLLLGPHRASRSGVSTHLNLLMSSSLAGEFEMVHLQSVNPFALAATIMFRRVSLVHINTSLDPGAYWRDLADLAVAKMLGARVVYQVHGGQLPQRFLAGRLFLTALVRRLLLMPDLVIVTARSELDAYRELIPEQHVVALPNGIDCRRYAAIPTVRSQPEEPLRLVYIGRVAREKGLYEALQGLRLAHELGVDARLVIAGNGAEGTRLRRYAQALGVAPRVCFVGSLSGADRVKLLAGADVMILPSYSEGLPHALLEGMAAGIPVIATPVGAIPDVVSDGIHGFLVPTRDGKAIAESLAVLAADRERLSWMSRACRRRIRAAFTIERLAQELALQYRRICGPRETVDGARAGRLRLATRPSLFSLVGQGFGRNSAPLSAVRRK